MRKVIVLLKKDITLDKINMLIVILISLGIPIYITYSLRDLGMVNGADFFSLLLGSFFCFFLAVGKLGMIEHKYSGTTYLTLTPVTRRDVVLSKYVFFIFVFLISVLGYEIVYLIIPFLQPLSFSSVIYVWTVNILFFGIYIPLEFKVGYENVKYYLTAVVVFSPFLIGIIGRYNGLSVISSFIEAGSKLLPFILVLSLILIVISYCVSVRVFEKKDL